MTNSRFLTLDKSDSKFNDTLWGKIEKGTVAIPIQSLNVGTYDESVTFELKNLYQIEKPNIFLLFSKIIKLNSFVFILFPLFYVLTKNILNESLSDPFSLSLASVSLCLLYAALNIRNDIADHISGFDRVNIPYTHKPILEGWITAKKSALLSWILIGGAGLFSIPVLLLHPEEIMLMVIVFALVLAGQFLNRNAYKEKKIGEIILFLLMGMGISTGLQLAAGAKIDSNILGFGFFWGSVILFLVHINNFSHLLTSTQAGIRNSITSRGFDHAKKFLFTWWCGCLLLGALFHANFSTKEMSRSQTLILVVVSLPFFLKLKAIQSPIGSDLVRIRRLAYRMTLVMIFVFFIECIYLLGSKLNWTI